MPALAQLLNVPSTVRPSGSAAVFMRAWPAAGPPIAIGVVAVKRLAYHDGRTICHSPLLSSTSITATPCAACAFFTFSALQVFRPSGCSRPSSVYSWFIARRPRVLLPASG